VPGPCLPPVSNTACAPAREGIAMPKKITTMGKVKKAAKTTDSIL